MSLPPYLLPSTSQSVAIGGKDPPFLSHPPYLIVGRMFLRSRLKPTHLSCDGFAIS